jgi:hypothetical protein
VTSPTVDPCSRRPPSCIAKLAIAYGTRTSAANAMAGDCTHSTADIICRCRWSIAIERMRAESTQVVLERRPALFITAARRMRIPRGLPKASRIRCTFDSHYSHQPSNRDTFCVRVGKCQATIPRANFGRQISLATLQTTALAPARYIMWNSFRPNCMAWHEAPFPDKFALNRDLLQAVPCDSLIRESSVTYDSMCDVPCLATRWFSRVRC